MLVTKEFKTIEEQIALLESRNLKFRNKKKAAEVLKQYNYFDVINGFETMLLKKGITEKKYEGVYFEDFYEFFRFDMKLKQVTLSIIFDIESRLRTSIAYNFAKTYCSTAADTMNYTNPKYYKAPNPSNKHMTNVFSAFDLFRATQYTPAGKIKRRSYIDELKDEKDYVRQYTEPPFWVVIKSLPLGSLYYIFLFLTPDVKENVLRDFGFSMSEESAFEQSLFVLKEARNQCAHLELITRFRLKKRKNLNNLQDITVKAGLSKTDLNYMDVVKILRLFDGVAEIKRTVFDFHFSMSMKFRKHIADKMLAKMGRKKLSAWLKI